MHARRSLFSLLAALVLGACSGEEAASPPGAYAIDHQRFVPKALAAMQAHGAAPAGAAREVQARLQLLRMDVDLRVDHTFECRMGLMGERRTYTGSWQQSGQSIRLEQTHEDGEDVEDLLTGTLRDGVLDLVHEENGLPMPYVLRRHAAAPAPR